MKKTVSVILAVMMMLMLTALTACGSKQDENAAESTAENTTESTNRAQEVTREGPMTYADVLKANEEGIRACSSQADVNGNEMTDNVLLYDLNGDGGPELMFMTGNETGGELHIYTMKDDEAVECRYDVPESPYIEDNRAAFAYILAGGGSNYMIYAGKEKGVFYAAYSIWSERSSSYSFKYKMDGDGLISIEESVYNLVYPQVAQNPDGTYSNTGEYSDEYELSGEAVSADEGAAVFTAHRKDYSELLMYDMRYGSLEQQKDFRVYENLKTDRPLASGYDDVMAELNGD